MDLSRQSVTIDNVSHPPASSKWASPESPGKYITREAHMDFPDHFKHIFQQLNQQRLHAQLCDCVVVVGSQSFQAHRSILAACSSHLRALLSSPEGDEGGGPRTDGAGGGAPSVIELDPGVVTPEAFSILLDMIYTSTLTVGASNVMDVLLAASHLHLNTVVKACKLHLSKRNFPTSPPKGWRSPVQQHQQSPSSQDAIMAVANSKQQRSVLLQHIGLSLITCAMEEELNKGEAGGEFSHSHGDENGGVGVSEVSGEQRTTFQTRHKRKSPLHEEWPGSRQKTCYGNGSPTVTWSTSNREEGGEGLPSPDSLKTDEGLLLLESRAKEGEGEVEEKYEARKEEFEERQLPSQSDSSATGVREEGDADREIVVKVKVGEEGQEDGEEEKMETVEVKRENLSSSSSPDLVAAPDELTPPTEYCTDHLDELASCEKISPSPPEGDCSSSNPQSCTVPQTDTHTGGDGGVESIDNEGLDSLSDLALSCFLNPSSESVIGALEVEESLANLTGTATATTTNSTTDEAHAVVGDSGELSQNLEATNTCSAPSSSSASSVVFPVTSIPFQQLLHTQGHSFSDTLILQPSQSSLSGILGGIKSGLSLQAPLIQPSVARKTSGCGGSAAPAFRRIAPKVVPGSEAHTDPQSPSSSSGSVGDAVHHSPLTRASEDVLSKCKKAASADHVLLVEGEKKYACRICCKTFMNLTDCKKHIRVHTGEKPYPCPKCGKRFSQSSHLYKHCNNTCLHWKTGP